MTRVRSNMAGNSRASLVIYAIGRALVVGVVRLWNRVSVEGRENVPREGPFILAPIHRSNLDTPYAACCQRRRVRFMGKDSLWTHRWIGWLLSALGGFPVSRGSADREALRRALEVLESGEPLVVFPEGTRQFGPLIQPLFEGAAYLATKTQVPVVPVGIGGSERVQQKGKKWVRPSKVHIIVGEPMRPPPMEGSRLPREEMRAFTQELHARLQDLFDRAQVRAGV
ncbi:MAG TPA: lysophospholipid acyltransferase family protein [Acidimicrobiales bacterium]